MQKSSRPLDAYTAIIAYPRLTIYTDSGTFEYSIREEVALKWQELM